MIRHRQSRAFTMVELAIAMVVFVVAILAVLALLPVGMKSQERARQQLYATALAVNLIESFHNTQSTVWGLDEGGAGGSGYWIDRGDVSQIAGNFSPTRGFGSMLRRHAVYSSQFSPDIERLLSNKVSGLIPVPIEIARRLDSENDEIRKLLDDGSYIYYMDPSMVRGLNWGHKFEFGKNVDSTKASRTDSDQQRLVIGFRGKPQQNVINHDPSFTAPRYEMYPYPPQWYMPNGLSEKRKQPKPVAGGIPVVGTSLSGLVNANLFYVDDGHLAFIWSSGKRAHPAYAANNTYSSHSMIGWIGYNWEFFARHQAGSIWAVNPTWVTDVATGPYATLAQPVWQAFRMLACGDVDVNGDGIGDGGKDGCAGYLIARSTEISGNGQYASLPTAGVPFPTNDNIGTPGKSANPAPTYEMRASYRDKAIQLWDELRPRGADRLRRYGGDANLITEYAVNDVNQIDSYEVPSTELKRFDYVDPRNLLDPIAYPGEWPIHPARVNALSFLAHAAMMVAGYRPPWRTEFLNYNSAGNPSHPDITKYTTFNPLISVQSGAVRGLHQLHAIDYNDGAFPHSPDECWLRQEVSGEKGVVHAGDFLWFSSNPDYVFEVDAPAAATAYEIRWSEDKNGNGALDAGEDLNGNGLLDTGYEPDNNNNGALEAAEDADSDGYRDLSMTKIKFIRCYPVADGGYGTATGVSPWPGTVPASGSVCIRVASLTDIEFARKVHEMGLRWSIAYAGETPLDVGAPRIVNRMVSFDRPLGLFDLWYDAGERHLASNGQAQRAVRNPARTAFTAAELTAWWQKESFYRWIYGSNPYLGGGSTGLSNRATARAYIGNGDTNGDGIINGSDSRPQTVMTGNYEFNSSSSTRSMSLIFDNSYHYDRLQSMYNNQHLREPTVGSDRERYWINRSFDPIHRTRELVIWSADWKSFEDAESAPSAPVDMMKFGMSPSRNNATAIDQVNTASLNPNYGGFPIHMSNPEFWLCWEDANRNTTAERQQTGSTTPNDPDSTDIALGHFGADRNGNGRLDIGPVPRSARMRANTVVRMNFYDPILYLHAGN